jgi:DNA-binding GntR family transcriptional regulator
MKMNNEINKKVSRSEHVYKELKIAILYGFPGFVPGSMLNENKIAEYFNVSKTPVRESLNRLRNENLVDVIPYKGYLVSNPSINELIDQFQLRIILETAAVELVTKNISDTQLEDLRYLTTKSSFIDEDFKLGFRKINLEFHTQLAVASGNKPLADVIKQVLEQMQRALFHNVSESEIEKHNQEHRELLDAIEKKNVELATKLIKQQIEFSKNRIFNYRMED